MGQPGLVVRWKISGFYFKDGIAYSRSVGDEDRMYPNEAQSYIWNGMVEVVGDEVPTVIIPPQEDA